MYLFELNRRLQKLSDRLFLDTERAVGQPSGEVTLALFYRRYGRCDTPRNADTAEAGVFERAGELDFVCAVPTNWVPERTKTCPKTKRILSRGWRDIAKVLAAKGLFPEYKVQALFHGQGRTK